MKKTMILAAFAAAVALYAQNPAQDFRKGQQYLSNSNFSKAAEFFDKAAQAASGDLKTKALLYKAIALGSTGKVSMEEAQAAVEAVPDEKMRSYARLNLLSCRQKRKQIIEEFDQVKIKDWSEDYAYIGWKMRGEAYVSGRQYDKAIADLLLSEKNAGSDQWIRICAESLLFEAYLGKKEYESALKYIDKIRERKNQRSSYRYLAPLLSSVDAYIPLKKFEEAHKTLDELDQVTKLSARKESYGCRYFISLGKLYAAEGKKEEAKAAFDKALACDKAHKFYLNMAKKAAEAVK